ncbi:Gfo/Idh/MocA family oxidoreductase [candidate division KSB1 bacterium]|nr:Gfo/Idh/MocA family oxidoreductase [candidate division KSB1 bacterium]
MHKIRWGVLSTAKIGRVKVIPAMQRSQYCEIVGIASRDLDKAKQVASELGIPKVYGSYQALLADSDIEAIYNPLPNHLHVPLSIQALEAGKHVLCEKPIAVTTAEAQKLLNASQKYPHLKVMEAFMYRLHPQWEKAKELVQTGKIGKLRTIHTIFSYYNVEPQNVRNMADIGGGGMLDIGCYCISLSRFIFGMEPARVSGLVEYDPEFKIDRLASGILDFGTGTATFTCSTQLSYFQRVQIFGTEGRIEIEIPFNAPFDRPTRLWLQQGDQFEEIQFEICNQYTIQGDRFSLAIINDSPVPTPLDDAIANMRVIEAVLESGKTNGWVKI